MPKIVTWPMTTTTEVGPRALYKAVHCSQPTPRRKDKLGWENAETEFHRPPSACVCVCVAASMCWVCRVTNKRRDLSVQFFFFFFFFLLTANSFKIWTNLNLLNGFIFQNKTQLSQMSKLLNHFHSHWKKTITIGDAAYLFCLLILTTNNLYFPLRCLKLLLSCSR